MRSFNYVRTRFAGGEDFVSDAPDEIARDVESLLASLPALSRSLDIGSLALPDRLGTLVHLRAGAYAGRVAFVHALVLAGDKPAAMIRDTEQLLLSKYGRSVTECADRVDALCEELRTLALHDAAGRVSELFVDAASLAELEPMAPPRHRPFGSRRRHSPRRQLRARAIAASRAVQRQLVAARIPERARSLAAQLSRSLGRGNTPWIVATAAWIAGAFLLGIGFATGQDEPAADPATAVAATVPEARAVTARVQAARAGAPPIRQTHIEAPAGGRAGVAPPARVTNVEVAARAGEGVVPDVSCGPPALPAASPAHDRVLADALLAAIARLEALEADARREPPAVAAAPPPKPREPREPREPEIARLQGTSAPVEIAGPKRASPPVASSVGRYASVVADYLIVRAGPGTEFPRLGRLPGGTAVRASRGERDGWTRIGEPLSGWVASQYLSAWAPPDEG